MSAAVAAAAAEEAGAAGEIRVLAVDYDESCLAALNQALVDCRCNVTTCSQATKALGMLVERRERFDLVLSDAYMPDMDVIRLIEHVGLEMDVPFAVMCSDSSSSSLLNALRHGALDYLVKPINTEELRNLCHHVVRIKSSDNYNEHAQSACIYCSKQSRPAKRKIEWTKEPSRVKSPRSSKGISTVHFPQKPEKFPVLQVQTGLKLETKEESSGSKRPRVLEDSGSKRPRFVDNSGLKTLRFVWTPTLHGKFVDAVLYLGINKATPSNIMPSMNVEGLPWANLDIHLQKYDLFLQRLACLPPFKETSVPPRVRTVKPRQGNATAFHSAPSDQQQQFVNESIRSEPNNFSEEGVISGRLKEFRKLKQLIGVSSNSVINVNLARTENVSVLPIVGHGGVGKTMLALKIFNDNNVRDYFDCTFWISASDVFDEQDLIRKFICSVAEHEMESDDLGCIQRVLTGGVVDQSKRFLFIVDNVQEDACTEFSDGWRNSIAILKHARPGSMVLMTTRSLKVANVFGTMDSFLLTDFPDVDLWELFKIHAFGYGSFISNRFLEDTGKRIVEKLNGIPLAAKILGRLLSLNLNAEYWSSILRSELWELPEEKNGVCPALVLSYQYLPSHLKQCFSFCSTYPKGYKFDKDILVDCWAAVGLVVPHEDMLVQDVGYLYFDQLVNRYFFQKFPTSSKYIMSDMLHDLAIFAAKNECLMIRDKNDLTRVQSNIRHLSVLSNNSLGRSSLKGLRYKKLQSLVCYGVDPSTNITRVVQGWLHKLTEIRMLSFVSCQLKELPESIGNLRHLRYLNISSCTFDKLPSSFWGLQKLEILDAQECKFQYLPKDITRLINLQRVKLKVDLINQFRDMPEIGKLSSLRQLPYFDVGNEHGRGIRELKNMNQLRGSLEISGLLNVISRYAAAEAELHKKNYLNKLILSWDQSERACTRQVTTAQEKEVLEGLCPSPYLKHLEIKCYMGVVLHPSWFAKERLRSLSSLSIYSCPNLASLSLQSSASTSNNRSSIGLSWLTKLSISRCRRLSSLERFLQPDYLPAIKVLHIEKCEDLVSLSAEGFAGFVHLEELELSECWSLNWSANLAFPPFLKELKLEACGDISESTLSCLGNLSTLTTLKLQFCHLVRSIPAQVWGDLVSLENLTIFYCKGLQSIGGSDAIAQIENVDIRDCPNLHDLEQPFHKGGNVH